PPDLKLDTPAIERLKEKRCIESTTYMRASHMKLLAAWRDDVVREGKRTYTAADGRIHQISLTGTCLNCHSNKDKFCDRCHDYSGAKPACWSCHIIPEEVR
ncbi:MAG: menaquinol oxidoreductase, partial [Syntrophus sp. RIFOXYC2_FULL_54_9]